MNADRKIIVVEDNIGDVQLVRFVLDKMEPKYHFLHFESGVELLEYSKDHSFDDIALVFLDYNLPKLNGKEMLSELRAQDNSKYVPIVLFSSSSAPSDIKQCYEMGVNGFVTKPLDYIAFCKTIEDIIHFWVEQNVWIPMNS